MRRKKKHDPSGAPPLPAMFVGDGEPAAAREPEPAKRPPPAPRQVSIDSWPAPPEAPARSRLRDFFALPPEAGEEPPPARPSASADESRDEGVSRLGCVGMVVLVVVGALVENLAPVSEGQKWLAMGAAAVVLLLLNGWMSLHDSDVAARDRGSERRMARLRNRLRRLFDIPVV